MWACKGGRVDIASCLIHRGADVNALDSDGETALMRAVRSGQEELVQLLIKNHVDVNTQCKKGLSALMFASVRGNTVNVTALMEHGAIVNLVDKDGYTALMLASQEGHVEVVKVLLKYGADLSFKTQGGLTARDLAAKRFHNDVEDLLRTITYDKKVEIGRQLINDLTPTPKDFPMEYITFCTQNFHKSRRKGEGSFGVVYLAIDPEDESIEFVVKRSKIDSLTEKDLKSLKDTFEKELRVRLLFLGISFSLL